MKVSEHWLRSLINPPLSATELADQLTNVGIEIDGSEKVGDLADELVWTLKIPANRGDCLSMEGIAREVSLLNNMPYVAVPNAAVLTKQAVVLPIKIENPELCPRYLGCCVINIQANAAIPLWLKNRLEWAGIRSISIIVDILNYVMLELGQPFHAFDLDKIDQEIIIRNAVAGEPLQLLDEQTIELKKETLVIADKSSALALAGIMGGLASSVSESTRSIFIECAYFDPIAVRLASKQYGIRTEGSIRFERGVDPALQKRALERVLQLVLELAGGECGHIVENTHQKCIPQAPTLFLRTQRIKQILGIEIPPAEVQGILQRAGMSVRTEADGFTVVPPSFRQDVSLEVDLIEEIARVYGLDRFPSATMPGSLDYHLNTEAETSTRQFKSFLVDRGYSEAITYSFIDPNALEFFRSKATPFIITNPIAADMAMMRDSLWPGLLQALKYNQHRQCTRVRLFEMGNCFREHAGKILELPMLAGVCAGSLLKEQWAVPTRSHDFYDVKGDLEALLTFLGAEDIHFMETDHATLHSGQAARIMMGEHTIGYVGALHPSIHKALALEDVVYLFELEIDHLKKHKIPAFKPISKFPAIRRDIAILIKDTILADLLKLAIQKSAGEYLEDLVIFDVYKGKGIEPGQKSVAVGLILRHSSRTLVEGEVNEIMQRVLSMLKEQFQAILRE